MWKMIISLWAIPILLALIAARRAASGGRIVAAHERRFLFGMSFGRRGLSLWFWIAFAILAIAFFALGVVQAVILLNFGMFWAVFAPLLTGTLAIFLLIVVLRSGLFYRAAPRGRHRSARDHVAYSPDFGPRGSV